MKKIAITMGDPGGIGPEIIVKALSSGIIRNLCHPIVIGNADAIKEAVKLTGRSLKVKTVTEASGSCSKNIIEVIHVESEISWKRCAPSKSSGRAIVKYIKKAAELAMNSKVDAVVTAPIAKESLALAGYKWPGHTELLAEVTDAKDFAMMFVSDIMKVILCTTHIPLKNVPMKIKSGLVLKTISLSSKAAAMLGIRKPRIAVAGLNPHAGEAGIMGREELLSIIPAIIKAQNKGIPVSGPYPPDVVFRKAFNGVFDIVVSMYHDQALIPFKMIAFDKGVNFTVGLPLIRTSPDHGTAFDIAWKNMADPSSMIEAIKLALKLNLPAGRQDCKRLL